MTAKEDRIWENLAVGGWKILKCVLNRL